jgi:putative copper export protein
VNSRKAQIIATLIPFVSAGLVLEAPFAWRALKTKKTSDIKVAIAYGVLQVVVWVAFAADQSTRPKEISNVTGVTVWACIFAAMFGAAWWFRPLNKEERMDQATQDQRPGSTYL